VVQCRGDGGADQYRKQDPKIASLAYYITHMKHAITSQSTLVEIVKNKISFETTTPQPHDVVQ
jgi:hypothetical protein